jgi:uncharacterized protein (DUF433 family)
MIVRDPRRCGGDPILAGTRTAVHAVISYLKHYEGDAERVRDEALPHLTMEQIHAAIVWYHEHQQEVDDILRQREEDYQRGLARMTAAP